MPRVRLIVQGIVQGVGFRYFARHEADAHGVCGWARNLRDGTVEIEAQAADEALSAFVEAIRRGPAYATVKTADVTPLPETDDDAGFGIRF